MKPSSMLLSIALLFSVLSCKDKLSDIDPTGANPDWTTESHSNDVKPNYEVVFPQSKVNTLEIVMTAADWAAIRADMKTKKGSDFGTRTTGTPGGNAGGVPSFGPEPAYFPLMVKFNGKSWKNVGFRLKGNSTLNSTWSAGIYKLPFRLKMDEYEDMFPEINNQRMYGFKELSMSPAAKDASLIREKVGADIFRMAGIPAAQTAFYKVYIDFGEGLKYCGVYTMVEVIDDSMVKDQFGEDKGNIYKPESNFMTFAQTAFEKKNNKTAADWSDVQSTISALNATNRTSDPAAWRANLEKVFNMDHFIKWLAVNTTMVSWDTYGAMAHNHYLYNHSTKKLMWIPWDNNEALTSNARVQLSLAGVANTLAVDFLCGG
ncbi:MAG: CotH kinase family protein [Spirosomataceae bacterium]